MVPSAVLALGGRGAAYAGFELWMLRAVTPVEYGMALRWAHVPAWVTIVSLVAFARLYLRAGRLWLAWTVCGMRTLALLLNFGPAPNLNYREISALRHVSFLGDTVSVGEGVRNPWMLVGQLSLLLLLVFVADASLAAWRRGDRRQALMVGGSLVFFAVGVAIESVLVLGGIVHAPLTASPLYLGLMAVMGYQLSDDVFRAARLSDEGLGWVLVTGGGGGEAATREDWRGASRCAAVRSDHRASRSSLARARMGSA